LESLEGLKTPFLSLVIPAYNEGRKIHQDLQAAFSYLDGKGYAYEIIVVDDGSTDDTASEVRRFQSEHSAVRYVGYGMNRGKGYALKTGILQAQGEVILFADAGNCVPYKDLENGLSLLEKGCDIAIGSRGLDGSRILVPQPLYRRIGSKCFSKVVRYLLGIKDIRDTQCGFKLFKRKAAHELFQMQITEGFMFDVETILNARRRGYQIEEFTVNWSNDADSRFKPFPGTLRQTAQVLRILWHCRIKKR